MLTRAGDTTYTWDIENRLLGVAKVGGPTEAHVYDVDGIRVRTTVTPPSGLAVATDYLVDTSGSLSHVVAETDGTGALKAYYVRGDELLAVMRPTGPTTWSTRYVHADGIGSIRRLTDEAGLITDGYTYTAFGELIAHTGTDPQPYAFAGEPYDRNSGFQYHRARWMDPNVGRFLGMDLWSGSLFEPASLHRYTYTHGDPVRDRDPSGLFNLTNAIVGFKVHDAIGRDFSMRTGGVANYFPIFSILQIDPETCWPSWAACLTKPDLVHPISAEVYEIKPRHLETVGFLELVAYIGTLDVNDPLRRNWTAGVSYVPPPYLFIDWLGGWDVAVTGPVSGVITYEAVSRAGVGLGLAALVVRAAWSARIAFSSLNMQFGLRPALGAGGL